MLVDGLGNLQGGSCRNGGACVVRRFFENMGLEVYNTYGPGARGFGYGRHVVTVPRIILSGGSIVSGFESDEKRPRLQSIIYGYDFLHGALLHQASIIQCISITC